MKKVKMIFAAFFLIVPGQCHGQTIAQLKPVKNTRQEDLI